MRSIRQNVLLLSALLYGILSLLLGNTFTAGTVARAQSGGNWQQLQPSGDLPSARYDHVLIALPDQGKLLLFGGRSRGTLGDTWLYRIAENRWEQLSLTPAPEPRFGMSAAYDAESGRVFVFGGQQTGFFNDIWEFDGRAEVWRSVAAQGTPPTPRYGQSAVIDPQSKTLIVSHGFARGRFDDTFAFDLTTSTWRDISPTDRPLKRCLHEAIYEPVSSTMILFGGCSSGFGPCPQGDTWSFDFTSGTWREITGSTTPAARSNPSLVGDDDGTAYLFGGRGERGVFYGDLWAYDAAGGQWQELAVSAGPAARSSHDAAWDSVQGVMYVFGGKTGDGDVNDLWVYTPSK
ncbi:MAG: hypothetical protein OHK0023_04580 [Anaerolineae bacterium]